MYVLLFAALLPAVVLLVKVYRMDKVEKEPPRLLWELVLFGALSGIVAGAAEVVLGRVLRDFLPSYTLLYQVLENFLVVALVEELCKFAPVRLFAWHHPAFNYRFDAVVYAMFSTLGFAALENVLYVMDGGLVTAVSRALLSVPGHAFFALYMGIYLGDAKLAEVRGDAYMRGHFLRLAIVVPVLLHGFWDFSLSVGSRYMAGGFLIFVVIFFVCAFRRLRRASQTDEPLDT